MLRGDQINYILALITIIIGFILGVTIIKYLTVHQSKIRIYFLLLFSELIIFVSLIYFNRDEFGIVLTLSFLLSVLVGYNFMTYMVLSIKDKRHIPKLTRKKGDLGKGHTAIIYFTHGEPEDYDPIGWINQFREFDEQKIKFIPFLIRPIFLYMLRKKYIHVGTSQHKKMHTKMMQSLEKRFRNEGDSTTKFYLSFLEDEPRPGAAVINALNGGASRIIVSEVFLTISNHTVEGEKLVKKLNFEDYGVSILFTGPLWNSKILQSMFVERVNKHLGKTDKKKVGVLLVGHGQPKEWDIEWPTETEQEIKFRKDVLELFVKDGYDRKNLDLAWMEFREPCTSEAIKKLLENKVEKIFYFSAAISANSIHSMCDVPKLISKCEIPNNIDVINLEAWNDDPLVIEAIKEKIDRVRFD